MRNGASRLNLGRLNIVLTLSGTTLSGNGAVNRGSGIFAYSYSETTLIVSNTLIDGDCGQPGPEVPSVTEASWISLGGNIESPGDSCGFRRGPDHDPRALARQGRE